MVKPNPTKKTPYVRIREKNTQIRTLTKSISDIAGYLGCTTDFDDIVVSLVETKTWKSGWVKAEAELDDLRKKMGFMISVEVDKNTFNSKLEAEKLKVEVERLNKIVDNNCKEKAVTAIIKDKKGFWDFLYKLFKLN